MMVSSHADNSANAVFAAATVDKLPVEVLGDIFKKYLQADDDTNCEHMLSAYPNGSTTPFPLELVCKAWKFAASLPSLWSSICICAPTKSIVPTVRYWLSKARKSPLSLVLFQDADNDGDVTNEILNLFVIYVDHWKDIDFFFRQAATPVNPLLHLSPGSAKLLESVSLQLWYWDRKDSDHVWDIVHSSPMLHRIRWDIDYLSLMNIPTGVPWAQLTRLSLFWFLGLKELLDVLKRCECLTELELHYVFGHFAPVRNAAAPRLTLPALHSLTLNCSVDPAPMFDCLTLPKLTSLDLSCVDDFRPRDYRTVLKFLARSRCRLAKFILFDPFIKDDGLISYLSSSSVQHITELQLTVVRDKIVRFLTHSADQKSFKLPLLEEIYLVDCQTSDGLVSDMAASRFAAEYLGGGGEHDNRVFSLKTIGLGKKLSAAHFPRDVSMFQELGEKGLHITLA